MDAFRWGAVVLGLVAIGCAPSLQVRTNVDHGADFRQFRTFRMADGGRAEADADTDLQKGEGAGDSGGEKDAAVANTYTKNRIDRALWARLAGVGLMPAGSEADLVVQYSVSVGRIRQVERPGYPYQTFDANGALPQLIYPANDWVQDHPAGTLVIELIDAHTGKLVWRADCRATGTDASDPDFIEKAIARAFRSYPLRTS